MTRDDYVEGIKSAFTTLGNRVAMTFLTTQFPILLNPILNKIVAYFVNLVIESMVNHAEMQAFFIYIDLRTSEQGRDFGEAAIKNAKAQKSGSQKEKDAAEKDLINKFRALAKLTN